MILTDTIITQLRKAAQIPPERLAMLRKECGDDAFEFVRLASHHGWLDRDVGGRVLGDTIHRTYLSLESTLFQPEVIKLLPQKMAQRYQAFRSTNLGKPSR